MCFDVQLYFNSLIIVLHVSTFYLMAWRSRFFSLLPLIFHSFAFYDGNQSFSDNSNIRKSQQPHPLIVIYTDSSPNGQDAVYQQHEPHQYGLDDIHKQHNETVQNRPEPKRNEMLKQRMWTLQFPNWWNTFFNG